MHANEKPPNVILILVDDLGWMDLGCQGSDYYRTPNIDQLSAQGMRFTNAYAACAVCSPTRAAVMTGRYPARTTVTDWIRARFQRGGIGTPDRNPTEFVGGPNRRLLCPPNPYWLEHDEVTIAELLRSSGYATCHIGKWHLGDPAWFPEHQGFDFNIGGCDLGQPPGYFDPYEGRYDFSGTLAPRRKGEFLTHREGDEAVKFIHAHKDRPFFLSYCPYAVHTPIQAIADVAETYKRKDKSALNAKYAALVESVDDAVGMILEALDTAGLAQQTLVIFTSDNGGLDNNGGPTENAPLRSGKGYAYEGGIRVPQIIRWPGVVSQNSLSRETAISVDLLPTICEAAGVRLPDHDVDGISLVSHLKSNGKSTLSRKGVYWHFPHYRHDPGPYSIIRSGPWKLIRFWEGPEFELYHLADDLSESQNLADTLPDRVRDMDSRLLQHLKSVNARLPRPNPDFRKKSNP